MTRKMRDYQDKLLEDLRDDLEEAQAYLNEALADEDPHVFLLALKNVHEAQGGQMSDLAKRANLSRENVYRILSKRGNPKLTSIIALLNAVGLSLAVQPSKRK